MLRQAGTLSSDEDCEKLSSGVRIPLLSGSIDTTLLSHLDEHTEPYCVRFAYKASSELYVSIALVFSLRADIQGDLSVEQIVVPEGHPVPR